MSVSFSLITFVYACVYEPLCEDVGPLAGAGFRLPQWKLWDQIQAFAFWQQVPSLDEPSI